MIFDCDCWSSTEGLHDETCATRYRWAYKQGPHTIKARTLRGFAFALIEWYVVAPLVHRLTGRIIEL